MCMIQINLFLCSRWSVRVWVWQKILKTHMCGVGVCGLKSYCVQSVRVCQNWLHTNTNIYIFESRIKNWIEWTTKMSKIWEKIRTRTYCKFLLLPFKCESQSGPEKPDDIRNTFTLWQEFLSQLPNFSAQLSSSIFSIHSNFYISK